MKQISLNKSISIEFTKNKFLISISLLFIKSLIKSFTTVQVLSCSYFIYGCCIIYFLFLFLGPFGHILKINASNIYFTTLLFNSFIIYCSFRLTCFLVKSLYTPLRLCARCFPIRLYASFNFPRFN